MKIPAQLFYTKTHEWAKRDGAKVLIGITDYAQKEISDVVFVELAKLGQTVEQGKPAAVVESVKAAFDIYAPVSGKVTQVNRELESNPGLVNEDCYGKGWFLEIESPAGNDEWTHLMTDEQYQAHLKQEAK